MSSTAAARCVIYARFSSDRQSETSAEDQVRDCRARADREGWEVVDVYSDLAISGATNRRPGMNAMLADAAAGSFDILLSEALDRIARDQADIATIYQRLAFAEVRIETLSEGSVNELHIGLKGTMGALFLKDLADKIRRGQRGSIARGRIPGGLCYGYDVVRELDEHGRIEAGRRRINPAQAAIVLRIVTDYAAGRSPRAIAHALNAEGVPSPRGGEWRASAISGHRARQLGILHNPIYVGRFVYNRVTMKRDPETRNRVSRVNDQAETKTLELPDLRIIDDALWQQVQEHREVRAAQPLVRRRRPQKLLTGLVRCGTCGASYAVISDGRLGCTRAREAGTCGNTGRIASVELQRRVLAGLEDKLLSAEAVSLLVREYHLERTRRHGELTRVRKGLERKLRTADAAVTRLVDAVAQGGANFADVRSALGGKIEERDRLRADIGEEDAPPVIVLNPQIVDAYRERVRGLVADLDGRDETAPAIVAAIRALIDRVTVSTTARNEHSIEVVGSLDAAVALASGTTSRKGSSLTVMSVAEEGFEPPTRGL